MIPVLLIRHATTDWNTEGRIQGRTDVPLNDAGRRELARRAIPPPYRAFAWHSSPLCRALETAWLLGARVPCLDARLAEMHYGDWEGSTREELRHRYGESVIDRREAQGLEFRPQNGESLGEVRARLVAWLLDVESGSRPVIGVTHKGVVRMAMALATGWDLTSRAPFRCDWSRAQLFAVARRPFALRLVRQNIPLEAWPGSRRGRSA